MTNVAIDMVWAILDAVRSHRCRVLVDVYGLADPSLVAARFPLLRHCAE